MTQVTQPVRTPRMTRRRGLFWGGLACVVVGLAMLGYVAWQLYGTNVVSRHRQQQQVDALQQEWAAPAAHGAEGGSAPADDGAEVEATALVRIPRFGESYVMPVLEGTSDDALSQGFGHFTGTADPGEEGNYALAGHRVTHGEPLRGMTDLEPGDTVEVETRTAIYTYVLDTDPEDLVIPFTESWVLAPFPVNPTTGGVGPDPARGRNLLTLTTCAELFHTDERMIAFGHLESTTAKPAGAGG